MCDELFLIWIESTDKERECLRDDHRQLLQLTCGK